VSAIDTVNGSTAGTLTLRQRAVGGIAKSSSLIPGASGNASSWLNGTNEGGGDLVVVSEAQGGEGASARVAGGAAEASARGLGQGLASVDVRATARAGDGYPADFHRSQGGAADGGAATLGEVYGESAGGGTVRARGEVFGGRGGLYGGNGTDAIVVDAVGGSTTGDLTLEQLAVGGAGAQAGSGVSRLDRSVSSASLVMVSDARGGEGREGSRDASGIADIGAGGGAESSARAMNDAGDVAIYSISRGGVGIHQPSGTAVAGGDGGAAVNQVFAQTSGDGSSIVLGDATAGSQARSGAFGGNGRAASFRWTTRGGNGGDATSGSEAVAAGNSYVEIHDRAVAGDGSSSNGIGGNGGTATAHATGRNAGSEAVRVVAEATGGSGGSGWFSTSGTTAGPFEAGLGGEAVATAAGFSSSGDVEVTAIQTAGDGGGVSSSAPSGRAADGVDSVMIDAVAGSTAGQLSLVQTAIAGDGGGRRGAGIGGAAHSELNAENAGGGSLAAIVEAMAGAGGVPDAGAGDAGRGGDAFGSSRISSTTADRVSLEVRAVGGEGGGEISFTSAGDVGARGGEARIDSAEAISNGGGDVFVIAEAIGGHGGRGRLAAGDGATVRLENAARGSSSGALTLIQRAVGGDAGRTLSSAIGVGGTAGEAHSAFEIATSSESLTLVSEAVGGRGAGSHAAGASGADATSSIEARNDAGGIDLLALARGGWVGSTISTTEVQFGGGRAEVDVFAETFGEGHDISIGNDSSEFGAAAGSGGVGTVGLGGGGNARSRSHAIARGASDVEIWDRARGGASLGTSGLPVDGGDASSTAIAKSGGAMRSIANAHAIGGSVSPSSAAGEIRAGRAEATAHAQGGGESRADARSDAGNLGGSRRGGIADVIAVSHSQANALGEISDAVAESRSQAGEIGVNFFDTSAVASGHRQAGAASAESMAGAEARLALSSDSDVAAFVSGAHARDGEWARVGLNLANDGSGVDIILRAEAGLSSEDLVVDSLEGVFVSFLELDGDLGGPLMDAVTFRIDNGDDVLVERTFTDQMTARAFFTSVLDLGDFAGGGILAEIDLRFTLEMVAPKAGAGLGTYFAIGTVVVPEPGTAVLLMFGLAIFSTRACGARDRRAY